MRIFVCYLVVPIDDEQFGTYYEFRFLDQLGAYTSENGAYNALLDWAEHLFARRNVRGIEKRLTVTVDGREYCVGPIELHDE